MNILKISPGSSLFPAGFIYQEITYPPGYYDIPSDTFLRPLDLNAQEGSFNLKLRMN